MNYDNKLKAKLRRDRKRDKKRHGMRVDNGVKLIARVIAARLRKQ